jgi:hypothetical protein
VQISFSPEAVCPWHGLFLGHSFFI